MDRVAHLLRCRVVREARRLNKRTASPIEDSPFSAGKLLDGTDVQAITAQGPQCITFSIEHNRVHSSCSGEVPATGPPRQRHADPQFFVLHQRLPLGVVFLFDKSDSV